MGFEEILRQVAFTCARFMAFCAHGILFGAPAIMLLVLRPSFAGVDEEGWAGGRQRLASRLDGLVQSALIASAIATLVAIALQATLVAELNEGDLSSPSFLSVFSTTFGQWHLFRFPLLAGLLVLLSGRVRVWALQPRGGAALSWWIGWLALALGLLATSSFTGHAAVSSPRAVGLLNDVAHLAAGSIWFAGIVILAVYVPDAWRGKDDVTRLHLLAPVVVRFSKVALVAITIVALTGTINSLLNVARIQDLWSSAYGISLTLKIALFLGILALGGINHFFLRVRMEKEVAGARAGSAQRTFRMTIAIELVIALSIIGVTGWLVGQAKTREGVAPQRAPISSGSTP
jgi:putative copper export protein